MWRVNYNKTDKNHEHVLMKRNTNTAGFRELHTRQTGEDYAAKHVKQLS